MLERKYSLLHADVRETHKCLTEFVQIVSTELHCTLKTFSTPFHDVYIIN
jgi:hypothetical protein